MNALSIPFAIVGLCWVGLVVAVAWLFRRDDDLAAGVQVGQVSPQQDSLQHQPSGPQPELLACVCDTCRRVRCTDRSWQVAARVTLPVGCMVSHGRCPVCSDAAMAELNRILPQRATLAHA